MSKKIEISTMNISVNVLMLDNKRFTKSVYKQLPEYDFDGELLMNPIQDVIIMGFVKDDSDAGKSVLVNYKGVLRRYDYPLFYWEHSSKNTIDSEVECEKVEKVLNDYGQIFISC